MNAPDFGREAIERLCQVDLGPGRRCALRAGHTGPHVPRPQKVGSRRRLGSARRNRLG
jgi:hypothetical protein